ncbi:20992_t:CDS:2 [Entrophospora sp. SA101]|nr:20992_t:CDS:2 [Entrophospora sp. SA101]
MEDEEVKKCISCGKLRNIKSLIENNKKVCYHCVNETIGRYEEKKNQGKHNTERVHDGIPYKINPLHLTHFIEEHNKKIKEYDALSEEEKDEYDKKN